MDTTTITDGRRVRGEKTRHAILARAMQIASVEGLEGLSIGRLATALGMSKSGLFAHFGSKEELQIKTLRAARRVYSDAAVSPAMTAPEGVARLRALLGAWFEYFAGGTFEGGCLFIASAAEFDNRPGPVRDLVRETMGMWVSLLRDQVAIAVERGELDADPDQLAWELNAIGLGLNWDVQLNGAHDALDRARAAVDARLR